METKFTPGPWTALDSEGQFGPFDGWNADNEYSNISEVAPIRSSDGVVALVVERDCDFSLEGSPTVVANACLIAAAPELYEALADLIKAHRAARVQLGYDDDGESDSIELAEAALAKARGEAA